MDLDGMNSYEHGPPLSFFEESSNVNHVQDEPTLQCHSPTNIYMPQVSDDQKPKIGQEFANLDDAHTFYNNYAKEGGFSTRIHSSRLSRSKGRENDIIMKEYVCFKEGEKSIRNVSDNVKRRRGHTREGCKARLRVVKSFSGQRPHYVVSIVDEGHNHPLSTPRKVGFLLSHRHVSEVKKCLTHQLSMANIPTHQQMSILELQSGGLGNIGCTEKDIRNEQTRVRKLLDGHDADLLYEHFLGEQKNNSSFKFVFESDSGGELTHVFWADASMRMAYSFFGDVVVFDTTYNTNRYGMIFAPILGVNNHGKTVTFSCAFLSDESTASFEWLFSQFLRFMPGPPPVMIITDQDLAIEKVIASKLAGTKHRYCIWHIMNKFSEKLGPQTYEAHFNSFKNCIWDSESREEFDDRWLKLLEIANLKDHSWLNSLFAMRKKWIPAYVRHIFSVGMSSSQRAESHHTFFKRFVDKRDSLTDFIQRFNRGLARQRYEELNDDHVNINERPSMKTPLPMEKQLSDSYTRFIFYKVQEEMWQSMLYKVNVKSDDATKCIYKVFKGGENGSRERELVDHKESEYISCSCKKFDWEGIPCRHMIAFLKKFNFDYLPTKYILRRWTKEAKMGKVVDDVGVEVTNACDTSLLARRTTLSQLSNRIIDKVLRDEDDFERFKDHLLQFNATLKPSIASNSVLGDSTTTILPRQSTYIDPSQVSFKGCGKRLKRGKEKSKPKGRRCNYCSAVGVSYDSRNCPKRRNGPSLLENCGSPSESQPNDEDDCNIGIDDEENS